MCFRRWRTKRWISWICCRPRRTCICWWITSPASSRLFRVWEWGTASRGGWPSCHGSWRTRWTMMKRHSCQSVVTQTWSILYIWIESISLIMKWDLPAYHLCLWRSGKYLRDDPDNTENEIYISRLLTEWTPPLRSPLNLLWSIPSLTQLSAFQIWHSTCEFILGWSWNMMMEILMLIRWQANWNLSGQTIRNARCGECAL